MTLVLDTDEARWLRDILGLVLWDHREAYNLFNDLDDVPGVIGCSDDDYEGPEVRGFTGNIQFKDPECVS